MKRLIGVAALALAACIPSRDNHADPSNAPTATLKLLDEGIGCVDAPVARSTVSRGHCIVLDASGTIDPLGLHPAFTFFLGTSQAATVVPLVKGVDYTEAAPGTARLTESFRLSLPTSVASIDPASDHPLAFRVVADNGRGRGEAFLSARFTNVRPVAVPPPPRTLPATGLPWDLGSSQVVLAFDPSRSFDPDGDPVQYCWTFFSPPSNAACTDLSMTRCSTNAADVCFERAYTFNSDTPIQSATLVVKDPNLSSLPAHTTVSVRSPNIWTSSWVAQTGLASSIAPLDRFDAIRRTIPGANLAAADLTGDIYHPGVAILSATGLSMWSLQAEDFDSAMTPYALPCDAAIARADRVNDRLWVLARNFTNLSLYSFTIGDNSGTGSFVPGVSITGLPSGGLELYGLDPGFVALDSQGRAWFYVNDTTPTIRIVDPSGTVQTIASPETAFVPIAAEARPGTSEMWILMVLPNNASQYAELIALDEQTLTMKRKFFLDGNIATEIHWIDREEAWLSLSDKGVLRFDADALDAGISWLDSVVQREPTILATAPGSGAVDPDGRLWTSSPTATEVYLVSSEGVQARLSGSGQPLFVDAQLGTVWDVDHNHALVYGLVAPGGDGAVTRTPIPGVRNADVDPIFGSAVISTAVPPAIILIGEDGSRRVFNRAVVAGVDRPMFAFDVIRFDPETRDRLWAANLGYSVEPAALWLVDLGAPPYATLTPLLDSTQVGLLASVGRPIIMEPLAPVPQPPFPNPPNFGSGAWTIRADGSVALISTAGGYAVSAGTVLAAENNNELHAARSLEDNGLCVASIDAGGAMAYGRYYSIAFDGGSSARVTRSIPPGETWSIAAVVAPGTGACWVAITARNSGGAFLYSEILPDLNAAPILETDGPITSLVMNPSLTFDESLFATVETPIGSERIRYDIRSGLVDGRLALPTAQSGEELVSSNASSLHGL